MKDLRTIAAEYLALEHPVGIVLDPEQVTSLLVGATRTVAGYRSFRGSDYSPGEEWKIDSSYTIDPSEWALVRPLFELQVQHANAIHLESSRTFGAEPYGRTTAELAMDIDRYINDTLPRRAFVQMIRTI